MQDAPHPGFTDHPPHVRCFSDAAAVAREAAQIILQAIQAEPALVLGLATGDTQLPLYAELRRALSVDPGLLADTTTFNLDEYVGLGPDNAGSFAAYMQRHLFAHIRPGRGRHHLPGGLAPDPQAEAAAYDTAIRVAGGIGLQILGIGRNGHIAFNEPPAQSDSLTRVVALSPATRAANAAQFSSPGDVPVQAITMGMRSILDARRIVLIATGQAKRDILALALRGPISPDCPASLLRYHPCVTVLLDAAAAHQGPALDR